MQMPPSSQKPLLTAPTITDPPLCTEFLLPQTLAHEQRLSKSPMGAASQGRGLLEEGPKEKGQGDDWNDAPSRHPTIPTDAGVAWLTEGLGQSMNCPLLTPD